MTPENRAGHFAVAFCADLLMEAPLHVATTSLLRHASAWIDFYLILPGYNEDRRARLLRSLDLAGKDYSVIFLEEPGLELTGSLRPFHGNRTPYFRLALPDLVPAGRLLYLDADTVCNLDVSPLADLPMEYPSGFVPYGVTYDCIERELFSSIGLANDTPAFNSGVMLFDLAAWRRDGLGARVLEFCRRYQQYDQTALIAACAGKFDPLDPRFNVHLYANTVFPGVESKPGLYHFVGSPKPWDLGGKSLHPSFKVYADGLARTVLERHSGGYASLGAWSRAFRVKGGYGRALLARLARSV